MQKNANIGSSLIFKIQIPPFTHSDWTVLTNEKFETTCLFVITVPVSGDIELWLNHFKIARFSYV